MINKCQVSSNKLREALKTRQALFVQNNPYFHLQIVSLQVQNASNGLVKGTIRLDDVIVNRRNIGVQGYAEHEILMSNRTNFRAELG